MARRFGRIAPIALCASLFCGISSSRALVFLPPRPFVPPGYACRWVPPVYRAVSDRIWVEQRVDMVPGWYEISPGHMERLYRQVITPAHWETTIHQVLIADGHWDLVAIAPPPPIFVPQPLPAAVGVEGYDSRAGESLNQFSGLGEWPAEK